MANLSDLRVVRSLMAIFILVLAGTRFRAEGQTFTVLYNLGSHSADPVSPLYSGIIAQGRDGNLYSSAVNHGSGEGGVFRITPAGVFTVMHGFSAADAAQNPQSGLTLGTDGNFYGTTSGCCELGTIFKMTPSGTVNTLYTFTGGADGKIPTAPPIQGIDGNFYGTASQGGNSGGFGTVYKITPSGTFMTLHPFADGTDAAFPFAPLVQATNGSFYGTTQAGGSFNAGNVFKITASGNFTTLFTFDGTHGGNPFDALIQGSDGNFYGTARHGGADSEGVVFKITPAGTITVLHSFAGTGDGTQPVGGLVQATDGNLYGTTSMATGASGCGTIFRVSTSGTNFATLFTFPSDGSMGCNPQVTLVQHTNGKLYGDTNGGGDTTVCDSSCGGVIFSLNANLHAFVSLLQYSGRVGKTIEFLGQGFTGTTKVSFNGTPATFTVKSGTYLTAIVPSGATTGFVTVTTPSGTLTSNKKFRVTPQITSFNPTSGPVGTVVTITGVSLTQTTKVTFGGVKATTFTVNSDTQVAATVPTGAVSGRIGITTVGGNATSAGVFTVQ
jgi:uncharacterized repeat protein (TIGR03803 family)